MTARWSVVAMACVVVATASVCVAQEPLRLTLDEAIARGLANSQRLAELQAREEGAAASEAGRRAAEMPIVSLSGGYMRTNHIEAFIIGVPNGPGRVIYPDVPDNFRTRIDLQWPIYTGGRLEALQRAAAAERQASVDDLAAARGDLQLETTRAYWALVTAIESEQVVTRSLETLGAHVRDLRNRLDQGLIPPNDLLTAEAQESRQRGLAIEATTTRGVAEADLRRLLGMDGAERIQPDATLGAVPALPGDVEALVAAARQQRPERRAIEMRVTSADERVKAAGASAFPQVNFGAGYDYANPNTRIFPRIDQWNTSWDVSVNAAWIVWDGGRRHAEEAEAAAGARAARTRVVEFDRQVNFEVRQRALELDSSRAAIAAAMDGVHSATEAHRVVLDRFRAGVATNTEVLDAEIDQLRAELDRTRALAGARMAEARLTRALGR